MNSAKTDLISELNTIDTTVVALVGMRVRHGDIIDAITPIFAPINRDMTFRGAIEGSRIGGIGGSETVLRQEGYLITDIQIHRGVYFGGSEVAHIQVTWSKLTEEGIDEDDTITSPRFGSGRFVTLEPTPIKLDTTPGNYISDLEYRVSGREFVNQLDIKQGRFSTKEVPHPEGV